MNALEFARVKKRMCDSYHTCQGCPFAELIECSLECTLGVQNATPEDIAIVEKWDKEHPLKTRRSELLKLFPHAAKYANEELDVCPKTLDTNFICQYKTGLDCEECEYMYWNEEIE